jgi:hypothetical protein
MESDTSAGGATVKPADAEMEPTLAMIVEVPVALVLASPEALTLATLLEELQFTEPVRLCVPPSVYVPVAVNCCVVPSGMESADGVTVNETSAGGPTVNALDPLMPPDVAVMFAAPMPMPLASPLLLISATDCVSELQDAEEVRSWVVPSV